jgi:hypothetical protein
MGRMPEVGCGQCIRRAVGRWSIRTVSFLRQVFFFVRQVLSVRQVLFVRQVLSAISDGFETLRRVAAEISCIPSAACTRPTARVAITISIQARGEWRAPRLNF